MSHCCPYFEYRPMDLTRTPGVYVIRLMHSFNNIQDFLAPYFLFKKGVFYHQLYLHVFHALFSPSKSQYIYYAKCYIVQEIDTRSSQNAILCRKLIQGLRKQRIAIANIFKHIQATCFHKLTVL